MRASQKSKQQKRGRPKASRLVQNKRQQKKRLPSSSDDETISLVSSDEDEVEVLTNVKPASNLHEEVKDHASPEALLADARFR